MNPILALHGALDGLKSLSLNTRAARQAAVTSCEVARSLCKPVDELVGRRVSVSSGTYRPAPSLSSVPRTASAWEQQARAGLVPNLNDVLADGPDALIRLANEQAAQVAREVT